LTLVLDTNVWLEWFVFDDPRVRPLVHRIEGADRSRVLATTPMLAEFAAVIARPAFGLSPQRIVELCERQRARVEPMPDAPDCRLACTDPDDRMFIDLAVAHRADWLITRDRALLRLRRAARRRFGLAIGTPDDWTAACL